MKANKPTRRQALGTICTGVLALPIIGKGSAGTDRKMLIRPKYGENRDLAYDLDMTGATAWVPGAKGLGFGKMRTQFQFAMITKKIIKLLGACTFVVRGNSLKSAGQNNNGVFQLAASRQQLNLMINKERFTTVAYNPLMKRELNMTLGKLGAFNFGPGLLPILPYLLPSVDKKFWTLVTTAPEKEVKAGDKWEQIYKTSIPGVTGKPISVWGKWHVTGWENFKNRKVLAISITGELTVENQPALLKSGDRVTISSGTYKANGKALWDVENGVLCSAVAEQKILVHSNKPITRALRSEYNISMKLLDTKGIK